MKRAKIRALATNGWPGFTESASRGLNQAFQLATILCAGCRKPHVARKHCNTRAILSCAPSIAWRTAKAAPNPAFDSI